MKRFGPHFLHSIWQHMRAHRFSISETPLDCSIVLVQQRGSARDNCSRDRLVILMITCSNVVLKCTTKVERGQEGQYPSCRVWWISSVLCVSVRLMTRGVSQAVFEISLYMRHSCQRHRRCRSPSWGGNASTAPNSSLQRTWINWQRWFHAVTQIIST